MNPKFECAYSLAFLLATTSNASKFYDDGWYTLTGKWVLRVDNRRMKTYEKVRAWIELGEQLAWMTVQLRPDPGMLRDIMEGKVLRLMQAYDEPPNVYYSFDLKGSAQAIQELRNKCQTATL